MENKEKYYLFKYIKMNISDPISCLFLTENFAVIGTMLGKIILTSLIDKNEITLQENSSENISSISYSNDNYINISIGDDEIQRYQIIKNNNSNYIKSYHKFPIHSSEEEHQSKCENCFIFLSSDNLLKIQLQPPEEGNVNLQVLPAEFEIKNIKSLNTIKKGVLSMGSYSIPFDFDGRFFVWVEYLSPQKTRLCFKDFLDKNKNIYNHEFEKKFGHISFIKIIDELHVLIVHSLNICDIRKLDDFFTLIETFVHNGDQIYNINIFNYPKSSSPSNNMDNFFDVNDKIFLNDNSIPKNKKYKGTGSEKYINNVCECDYSQVPIVKNFFQFTKFTKYSVNNSKNFAKKIAVITLDIDGNVNWHENSQEKTLFNIYEIENIYEKTKCKEGKYFFDMGYEYYIKNNLSCFCISTDIGCLIIKKF